MNLDEISKRIPRWYQAGIDTSRQDRIRCRYLRGPIGVGKTSVLRDAGPQLGKQLNKNIGVVIISGPLLTPADAVGYLVPKHMPDGRAESLFTDPPWFRTSKGLRLDEYDGGIIVVDEADKMDTDVKKCIGEAALSGRLGPHHIPDTWLVWMAGNRGEDRSGSTKELDHLINRRQEINVTGSIVAWLKWADTHGVMPATQAFGASNPHIVFPDKVPDKQGPFCTPRSITMLDNDLQHTRGEGDDIPVNDETIEEAGGIIGDAAAAQYFAFLRLDKEMPKFEEIIKAPDKVKVPDKPDAQMLVCYNLAHRVEDSTAEPVVRYVNRLPKEFAVTFATSACRRKPLLVSTPAFSKWALENSSLMAAIAKS